MNTKTNQWTNEETSALQTAIDQSRIAPGRFWSNLHSHPLVAPMLGRHTQLAVDFRARKLMQPKKKAKKLAVRAVAAPQTNGVSHSPQAAYCPFCGENIKHVLRSAP